ncbi:hypothetical protein GEMRC1_011907 [Eukaryota sp. GEM-RC1]
MRRLLILILLFSIVISEVYIKSYPSRLDEKFSPKPLSNFVQDGNSLIQVIVSVSPLSHITSLLSDHVILGDFIPTNSFILYISKPSVISSFEDDPMFPPELRSLTHSSSKFDRSEVTILVVLVPSRARQQSIQDIISSLSLPSLKVLSPDRFSLSFPLSDLHSTIELLSKKPFVHWIESAPYSSPTTTLVRLLPLDPPSPWKGFMRRNLLGKGKWWEKVVTYRVLGDRVDTPNGHGTHVSGSIAGHAESFTNNEELLNISGIAFNSKLAFTDMAVGPLLVDPGDLYNNLFLPHYDEVGARIYSNSWGTSSQFYTTHSRDVDSFVWDHKDFLPIFAAGNDGRDGYSTLAAPSNSKNCLSVGAVQTSQAGYIDACCTNDRCCGDINHIRDNPHRYSVSNLATFSSKGPTSDLRVKPDILMVGGPLKSARSQRDDEHCDSTFMQGTSMATPLVAGSAAIVRQYFLTGFHLNTSFNPSSSLLKAVLFAGSVPVSTDSSMTPVPRAPSPAQGQGRLNLTRSLPLDDSHFLFVVDDDEFDDVDDLFEYFVRVEDFSSDFPLRFVLTWVDPPAAVFSTFTLVNDLDLIVIDPNQNVHYGNMKSTRDVLNNVEVISDLNTSGLYRVIISATRLATRPQSFSLVVIGFRGQNLSRDHDDVTTFLSQCPLNCSSRGDCTDGFCDCESGWTGSGCELSRCHDSCSNHGDCINGECDCHPGFGLAFDCSVGFCRDTASFRQRDGIITDHSNFDGFSTYQINMDCGWLIQPDDVDSSDIIVLEFSRFDLEERFDFVEVFDGHSPDSSRIGSFTGSGIPPPVRSSGQEMFVRFRSDSSVNKHGFEAFFSTKTRNDVFPEFDCFGVGNYSSESSTCDCERGFSGPFCSEIDCNDDVFDLDTYTYSFEFTSNADPTPPRGALSSTNISFGGPVSRWRVRPVDNNAATIGVVSNELTVTCAAGDDPNQKRLGTGSVSGIEIGDAGHQIIIDLNHGAMRFESIFFHSTSEPYSIRLLVMNLEGDVLHQFLTTGEEIDGCSNSQLYCGKLEWNRSNNNDSQLAFRFEIASEGNDPFVIDDVMITSECSGFSLPTTSIFVFLIGFFVLLFYCDCLNNINSSNK